MLSENAILAVASTSIISLTAMATMVTYLMLRESTSSSKAFEQMKNTSEASIEVEVVTLDLTVATCAYPGWIKDGLCDLLNNFESCQFDGGDCNPACARPDVVGDGKCDEENDTVECNEDGQDCMTISCPIPWQAGDGVCHSWNNVPSCKFDDGDCEFSN